MDASNWLNARAKENNVLIEITVPFGHIRFYGASCKVTSVVPGSIQLTSLTVCPEKDISGLVAIGVYLDATTTRKSATDHEYFFLLPANHIRGPIVDVHDNWIPLSGKLIQLDGGNITVVTDTEKFVHPFTYSPGNTMVINYWNQVGYTIVPDANLLCRFAVGVATIEELRAAAVEAAVLESLPDKLRRLEQENEERKDLLKQLIAQHADQVARIIELQAQLETARHRTAQLEKMYSVVETMNTQLRADLDKETEYHRQNIDEVVAAGALIRQIMDISNRKPWLLPNRTRFKMIEAELDRYSATTT